MQNRHAMRLALVLAPAALGAPIASVTPISAPGRLVAPDGTWLRSHCRGWRWRRNRCRRTGIAISIRPRRRIYRRRTTRFTLFVTWLTAPFYRRDGALITKISRIATLLPVLRIIAFRPGCILRYDNRCRHRSRAIVLLPAAARLTPVVTTALPAMRHPLIPRTRRFPATRYPLITRAPQPQ